MTQDDKAAAKDIMDGMALAGFVVGSFILGLFLIGWTQNPPVEEQSTKVVGEYKGCDIIQWNYGSLAEYKYFLYCPNEREI